MTASLEHIKELQAEFSRNEENIRFKMWLSLGFVAALIIDIFFLNIENKVIHAVFFIIIIAALLGSLATNHYRNKDIRYKLDRLCFEKYKKYYDECHFDIMNEK